MKEIAILQTTDRDLGVFAQMDFPKGKIVVHGRKVKEVPYRTSHSFQVGFGQHIQMDKISRSINHACEPNTGVRNNRNGAYDFIALRAIKAGEEITWDYETTEFISISIGRCFCSSKHCRKEIKGFKYLPYRVIRKYGIYIADYLKETVVKDYIDAYYFLYSCVKQEKGII